MNKIKFSLAFLGILAGFSVNAGKPMNVATYNLRQQNNVDGENSWSNRKENVKKLIQYHEFDIFGTQEGFANQLTDLLEMSEFSYTGHGREDGKSAGEHSAIFYRKDRFTLLNSGDFWLREDADHPGLGWDATCCNRICSWGQFKDKESGKKFFFFSVHFDHQGVIARIESAKLMIKKIKQIAGNYAVICVGDFNSTPETEQIKTMQTLLKDSREICKTPAYGPIGSFNGFKIGVRVTELIDYVFVSRTIEVLKYGILTDNYDCKYPSDHFPVVTKVQIR